MHFLLATFLTLVLAASAAPAKVICSGPGRSQTCPPGLYCDLGISRCYSCKTVCDKESKLKNEMQCIRECPDYKYLLYMTQEEHDRAKQKQGEESHSTESREQTTSSPLQAATTTPLDSSFGNVIDPKSQTESVEKLDEKVSEQNSNLHTPLLYLLVLLVVVVVFLALGLIIAVIFYYIKEAVRVKRAEKAGRLLNKEQETGLSTEVTQQLVHAGNG